MTINSKHDLMVWLTEYIPGIDDFGDDYTETVIEQLLYHDHPDWGDDWRLWLTELVADTSFIETILYGVESRKG